MRFLSFFVLRLAAFLLIVVTCTVGREDITKLGVLVHRAQSVGSLGQVRTLCFSKTDILTGMQASKETANSQVGNEGLVEDRIRQILGDYAIARRLETLSARPWLTPLLATAVRSLKKLRIFRCMAGAVSPLITMFCGALRY